MKSKRFAFVNENVCVSCGACLGACMINAISTPNGCYAVVNKEMCVGCGRCSKVCPTGCIDLLDRTGA